MLAIEAYKKFLLKINKNDTNSDIDINKGEFVLLYNEQKDKWLENKIAKSQANDNVEDLEEVQVKHFLLSKVQDQTGYSTFSLPDNFFSYLSSYSHCSSDSCKDVIVYHYLIKPRNENMLLENSNTQPSLDFEETIVDLSENKLFVYKSDFSVDTTSLNYYRKIGEIDIEGYRKVDGKESKSINPDVSDMTVDKILDHCVIEVIRRYENPDGFQLAQHRIQTED
jgi:hypothetical protein